MNNLVEMIDGEARTTSNLIGKEFGIAHKELLRKIDNFAVEISPLRFGKMYIKGTRDARGRSYKNYSISRDGYMFLVMNISTRAANSKKLAFIDAFNDMERHIVKSPSVMTKINETIRLLEDDKEKASACASGLSQWRKIKREHGTEIKKLVDAAQLILQLEA